MSILSAETLRGMIHPYEPGQARAVSLIDEVDAEDLENIEGSTYDFHVSEVHARAGYDVPIIGVDIGRTPKLRKLCCKPAELAEFDCVLHDLEPGKRQQLGNIWYLPMGLYQIKLREWVTIPAGIMGFVCRRLSCGLSGAIMLGTRIPPEYTGIMRVTMAVLDPIGVVLEWDARAITVAFSYMDNKDASACDGYNRTGRWHTKDKMQTDGTERGF